MQWLEYVRNLLKDDFERGQKLLADIMNLIRSNAEMLKHAKDTAAEFGKDFWSDMKAAAERVKESLRDALHQIQEEISKVKGEIVELKTNMQEVKMRIIRGGEEFASGIHAFIDSSNLSADEKSEVSVLVSQHQREVMDFAQSLTPEEDVASLQVRSEELKEKTKELAQVMKETFKLEGEIDKLFDDLNDIVDVTTNEYCSLSIEHEKKQEELEALKGKEKILDQEMREISKMIFPEEHRQEVDDSRPSP